MTEKLLIIGGGHAAAALCASLVADGYLAEGDRQIHLVSEEAHLPYQRPPLSKAYIKGAFNGGGQGLSLLRPASFYEDAGIEVTLSSQVMRIHRDKRLVETASSEQIDYDKLVLATGAGARALTLPGAGSENVHTIRTVEDADAVAEAIGAASKVVVIGGGFIGLETGATLLQQGLDVTLLESAERLMARSLAPEIARFVASHLSDLGMKFAFSAQVDELLCNADMVTAVKTNAGEFECDLVVLGIGSAPNTKLAQDAGLSCSNGITVDETLQTSDPDVYAIGDCASFPMKDAGSLRLEAVSNAADHARALSQTLVGNSKPFFSHPWFWSDQADLKLQMAGLSQGATQSVQRGEPSATGFSVFHFKDDELIAVDSVNKPADHMFGRKALDLGMNFTPEMAANTEIDLRELLKRQRSVPA